MSAEDAIEETINGTLAEELDVIVNDCSVVAAAVIATIRAMKPLVMAELIEGEVEGLREFVFDGPNTGRSVPTFGRVVGPWIPTPPAEEQAP